MLEVMDCYSPAAIQNSFAPLVELKLRPWIVDGYQLGDMDGKNDDYFATIWPLLLHPQYDTFVARMYSSILPTIKMELSSEWSKLPRIIVPLMIIPILLEASCAIKLKAIENHIKGVLRIFIHFSPAEIQGGILTVDFSRLPKYSSFSGLLRF